MKKFKRQLLAIAAVLVLGIGLALPATLPASASSKSEICQGIGLTGGDCSSGSGTKKINHTITNIVNLFSVVVGIAAVIMIIVGGMRFITSGGESNAVASAKKTIMYALIGLIIVALAQVIVHFVLSQGANVAGTPPPK